MAKQGTLSVREPEMQPATRAAPPANPSFSLILLSYAGVFGAFLLITIGFF